jgi:hypothetical protein
VVFQEGEREEGEGVVTFIGVSCNYSSFRAMRKILRMRRREILTGLTVARLW